MKEPEDLKDTYNKIAEDWHKDHQQDDWWVESTDKFIEVVGEGSKILDVGCGVGHQAAYMSKRGLNITGVDFAPKLLDIAKKLVPFGKFHEFNIYDLDKLPGQFDGVYASAVLLHFPKKYIPEIIQKLYRKLNDGGYLCIAVKELNEGEPEEEIKSEFRYGTDVERFFSYFTLDELREYLKQLKLKIVYENVAPTGSTNWLQIIGQK